MPAERYYIPTPFDQGAKLVLEDQEHHHLAHVMRARQGEELELVNGQGQLALAVIESLEKKRAVLLTLSVHTAPLPQKKIILAQGLPRLNRLEFILEKGTELGVNEFWIFPAARSEKKELSQNQIDRVQTITVAAMKQCGRLFLPKVVLMPALKQWPPVPGFNSFFGDVRPTAPLFSHAWDQNPSLSEALFFVGPESGFTDEEVTLMERQGASGVKLHHNILRTDTAAIAALSLLSHWML